MQATPSTGPQVGTGGNAPEGKEKKGWPAWALPCAIGCGAIALAGLLAGGMVAAIIVPNFSRARDRANKRACFANQKTIAGAVEMHNLDYEEHQVRELTSPVLDDLLRNGYLQARPRDPGGDDRSSSHYMIFYAPGDTTPTPSCTHHGFIQPPAGSRSTSSPREQLQAFGVTDGAVLARCSTEPPLSH